MNVTVLVAHPDDELMCAGTIARLAGLGDRVRLIVGFFSDFGADHQKQGRREERLGELSRSAKALGVDDNLIFADFDEPSFVWSQPWVQRFERLVQEQPPRLLISHRVGDANTSHAHLARVARTLARKNTFDLWEMDQAMPGGLEPDAPGPNHLVDISDVRFHKQAAIEAYGSQLDRYPGMENAIVARDVMYGWMCGVDLAEAFRIVKGVDR